MDGGGEKSVPKDSVSPTDFNRSNDKSTFTAA